nr:unnamed protein product [Callosobruchus analis]
MKKCLIGTCTSNSRHGSIPGISYHKLGKTRFRSWLKAINRSEKEGITPHNLLCSRHFEPSDFVYVAGKKFLKNNAVPSLHLPGIKKRAVETEERNNSSSKKDPPQVTWTKITKVGMCKKPLVCNRPSANNLFHSANRSSDCKVLAQIYQDAAPTEASKNIKTEKHTIKNNTLLSSNFAKNYIKPNKGISTDIYRNCAIEDNSLTEENADKHLIYQERILRDTCCLEKSPQIGFVERSSLECWR